MGTLGLLLRVAASLAAVLGLVWMVRRGMLRSGGPRARAAVGSIEVLARHQLSGRASVALVAVGDTGLVLGVTDQSVTVLDRRPAEQLLAARDGRVTAVRRTPLDVGHLEPVTAEPAVLPQGTDVRAVEVGRPRTGRPAGALAGSALSPATWNQALEVLRERTARR